MWWVFRLFSLVLVVATAPRWWPVLRTTPSALRSRRWGPLLLHAGLAVGLLGLVAQAVPYGWKQDNPPVVAEPAWDSARTRELFVRACADCHSNETQWLWFTNIAPGSWLAANDVYGGRDELNLSEWTAGNERNARRARDSAEVTRDGSMPPLQFTLLHPEARLTDAEKADLATGLEASLAK